MTAVAPPPSAHVLPPHEARRAFLILSCTRWLPVGLVVGILTLVALERGLTITEVMSYSVAQGIVVMLLELPSSGFADVFGRRPLLLLAGVVNVLSGLAFLAAHTFWEFAAAAALMGLYRALDSGPLDAWFVDTIHATTPGVDVDRDLARQGTVIGLAIALGSIASGGLIAWHPIASQSAFPLPILVFVGLNVVHLLATAALMTEPPRHSGPRLRAVKGALRETPAVIGAGLRLLRHNGVLAGIVAVEIFWVIGMAVFETFQPVRLAEMLGSEDRAGVWMGPTAAAGWAAFAVGAHLAGRLSSRFGVARTAIIARVCNGLGAAVMGLTLGPAALVSAYLVTYSLHGLGGAPHLALLHREAAPENRATVVSINSMSMFAAGIVVMPALGALAQQTSTQTAMVVAGVTSILGAACYLPALRPERARRSDAAA